MLSCSTNNGRNKAQLTLVLLSQRRTERVKWTDRITNETLLKRVGEERMLKLIRNRKMNWLGHWHWLRRNCLLKDSMEGMVNRSSGQKKCKLKCFGRLLEDREEIFTNFYAKETKDEQDSQALVEVVQVKRRRPQEMNQRSHVRVISNILNFNHWWKAYFKKSVLSIESMGRGVKRDQKVTFHVNDFMEFQYEVDHISERNFIDGLTVHTFKLFLSRSVLPMLPSVPAYPHGYVALNEKKLSDIKKLEPYIPTEYHDFYNKLYTWPTTSTDD
ncbi:hypothetical protein ANN_19326 [Periplaneta americana]|uniref:Uncharacterized protein n=1 Tax=Periplaneta americana TaxID=6978 RepID=A0ABQ8S9S0_PERAM|nr:hypothetical protein ANN_19326 [Periplaneta americana]